MFFFVPQVGVDWKTLLVDWRTLQEEGRPAGLPTAHVARIIINLDVRVCCFCVAGWRGLAAAQQMNQAPSRQRHMRMSLFNRFGRGQEEDVDPDRPDDVGPVERPPRSGGPAGHQEGEAG